MPSHDHGLINGDPMVIGGALSRDALLSTRLTPLALPCTVALLTVFLGQLHWATEPGFGVGASFDSLESLTDRAEPDWGDVWSQFALTLGQATVNRSCHSLTKGRKPSLKAKVMLGSATLLLNSKVLL